MEALVVWFGNCDNGHTDTIYLKDGDPPREVCVRLRDEAGAGREEYGFCASPMSWRQRHAAGSTMTRISLLEANGSLYVTDGTRTLAVPRERWRESMFVADVIGGIGDLEWTEIDNLEQSPYARQVVRTGAPEGSPGWLSIWEPYTVAWYNGADLEVLYPGLEARRYITGAATERSRDELVALGQGARA